jgi:hypothetical protein
MGKTAQNFCSPQTVVLIQAVIAIRHRNFPEPDRFVPYAPHDPHVLTCHPDRMEPL